MPLILGTNSIKDTGFNVANSCRFDTNASMTKTSSTGSNTKSTLSVWVKRSKLGAEQKIFNFTGGSNNFNIEFKSTDILAVSSYDGSSQMNLRPSRVFRDVSAWYHIVIAIDTTQGTAANRVKIYVNGVQESSFGTETYPAEDETIEMNGRNSTNPFVGQDGGDDKFFNGYLAELVWIDGSQLAADSFGEFDSDSGIWKPINVSGLTFGTNGFYLDFEASGNLGNDANGGTDLGETNIAATDQSIDTCTNNFCTINSLDNESGNITITEGNLNFKVTGNADETNRGTFGFTKGKWYFESKYIDDTGDGQYVLIGVASASDQDIGTPRSDMERTGYYSIQLTSTSPGVRPFDNGSAGSGLGNSAVDDIHMYAIDMDNNRFYAGRNGTWYASGDPAGNANPLITMDDGYTTLMPSICTKQDGIAALNFGSPSYAISSGNADGNGFGNFEYAVPSGYFSLCTKNLAEHG